MLQPEILLWNYMYVFLSCLGKKASESPVTPLKRSNSPTPPGSFLSVSPNPSRRQPSLSSKGESDNDSDSTSPHNSRTNSTQSSPSTSRRSESRKESDASIGSVGSSEIYRVCYILHRKRRSVKLVYSVYVYIVFLYEEKSSS